MTVDILTGEEQTYEEDRKVFISLLESRTRFTFVRFGDAEFECMAGIRGRSRDRQPYGPELAAALTDAFRYLCGRDDVYLAQRCAPKLRERIEAIVPLSGRKYYDADSLLLHYRSFALESFYRVLIQDNRRKIYVAPRQLNRAKPLLKCADRIEVPRPDAFSVYAEVRDKLIAQNQDDTVYLFSAGHAAKVWIADVLKDGKPVTCIDLGSALDPIYIGQTRTGQPTMREAVSFFHRAGYQP